MWTPSWLDSDSFYSLKVLAYFRHKQLVDFSTYNTQIICLTGAIISKCKAHYNHKYKYVQRCEGICPLQYVTYFRKKEYVYDINAAVWLISTDIHDSLFLFQPDKAVSSVLSGPHKHKVKCSML